MIKTFLHQTADVLGFLLLQLFKLSGLGTSSETYQTSKARKILVIRTDRIGDVVLSTPAFHALRHHFPEAYMACLVALYTRDLVEGNPVFNEVYTYDRKILRRPLRLARFIAGLRRSGFDTAVVLNYAPDAILLAYLSGAPVRVGTRIPGFGRFLTESISYQDRDLAGRHEVECVLDVLRNIGIDADGKDLYIPLSEKGESFAARFMADNGLDRRQLVAMHPGSRLPRMRWNRMGFARVADTLIREMDVQVILIQGPGEEGLISDIVSSMLEKPLLTPQGIGIAELVSLLKRCSLFIGNSTGPMHLAAGLTIPVVALFGNARPMESHEKWGPWEPPYRDPRLPHKF